MRIAWNKGKKEELKVTQKRSIALKLWWSNPKNRETMSMLHKGQKPYNTGTKGIHLVGKNNPQWKGDNVGYRSLHRWVERKLGKAAECINDLTHKSTRYHWANISKEYKRDLADWVQLCPSCNCKDRIGRRIAP